MQTGCIYTVRRKVFPFSCLPRHLPLFSLLLLLLLFLLLMLQLGAEEGEDLAGTPLGVGPTGGGSGLKAGGGGSGGVGSEAAAAAAAAAEATSGPSRAQLQKMRRRAKQEVLKIDKQRRIELVKQGKSAYELRALAAAEVRHLLKLQLLLLLLPLLLPMLLHLVVLLLALSGWCCSPAVAPFAEGSAVVGRAPDIPLLMALLMILLRTYLEFGVVLDVFFNLFLQSFQWIHRCVCCSVLRLMHGFLYA